MQQNIAITDLVKPRIQLRPVRRKAPEYQELVQSVRKDGILQPILVRPLEEGKFEVIEGLHRFEASKEAGLTEIPCLLREMTDRDVMIAQLKCNSIRPKTRTFEFARRLKILMDEGLTLQELSAIVDKCPEWVRQQLYLNRLCEPARPYVERGEMPISSALALANLPDELQKNFIEDAVALPNKEFEPRAKEALRDYKSHLLQETQENKEIGAATPKLRSINVIKKEALDPKQAPEVLKAMKAKTPLDGWEACMAWIFRLEPATVTKRKENYDENLMSREEFRRTNQEMIKKYVKTQTSNGDYRNDK